MRMNRLFLAAAAVASLAFIVPASAQDILIETSITPVYEISAPVAGVAGVPGRGSTFKDRYLPPVAETKDAALNRNQCWTSASMERKTAGTQGAGGVCIWNNASLASSGHGAIRAIPGIAAVDGVYGQGWLGLDIPAGTPIWDFSHEHDLIHEHQCSGQSAPSSC